MKEISPKVLQKLNDKSFKETKKAFRRRLRELAANGENKARYKPDYYCCGDRIADWLRSLGFTVKQINPIWCEVTWGARTEKQEGTWQKDMKQYDYVCSVCGKHAEYVSDYCPNCGKKMATLLDGNRY